jgi:hypothetical protein
VKSEICSQSLFVKERRAKCANDRSLLKSDKQNFLTIALVNEQKSKEQFALKELLKKRVICTENQRATLILGNMS